MLHVRMNEGSCNQDKLHASNMKRIGTTYITMVHKLLYRYTLHEAYADPLVYRLISKQDSYNLLRAPATFFFL